MADVAGEEIVSLILLRLTWRLIKCHDRVLLARRWKRWPPSVPLAIHIHVLDNWQRSQSPMVACAERSGAVSISGSLRRPSGIMPLD